MADKGINYHPNPAPGNKPIAVGHAYSVLAYLPEKTSLTHSPWIIPLSVDRVKTSEKGHEVGPIKLRELIRDICLPLGNELCVHVGDSSYFVLPNLDIHSNPGNLVLLSRLKSNRTVYTKASNESRKTYGDKMKLNDKSTHSSPDQIYEFETTMGNDRAVTVEIKIWEDRLVRGTREIKGNENPFNLYQVCLYDATTGKQIYIRPLWLTVSGKRRSELDVYSVYMSYRQRYDIEHFFRFGKQKLLMDSFQTPDVTHEENWWQLVQLAYTQLYLSRNICQLIPSWWEHYLPKFKNQLGNLTLDVSPSLAQRYFPKLLEIIGTPAHDVRIRKSGKGRQEGEIQVKREKQPVIFKCKKSKKKSKPSAQKKPTSEICEFEKYIDMLKTPNPDAFMEILKSCMPKMDISKADLLQMIAKELQT